MTTTRAVDKNEDVAFLIQQLQLSMMEDRKRQHGKRSSSSGSLEANAPLKETSTSRVLEREINPREDLQTSSSYTDAPQQGILTLNLLLNQINDAFLQLQELEDLPPPWSPGTPGDINNSASKQSFFGRQKVSKSMVIEKLQAKQKKLKEDCLFMMQTVKKVFASGSMAATLLQQEVEGLQSTVDNKNRELEGAYDIIATQEDKINSMASQLKDITEKLKKNALENNNPRSGFLKTMNKFQPATPTPAPKNDASADLERLESELDAAHGKIEALTHQQGLQAEQYGSQMHKLKGELEESKRERDELKATLKATQQKLSRMYNDMVKLEQAYERLQEGNERLQEEIDVTTGQNEAIKYQVALRNGNLDEQLMEAQRLVEEMEIRLKDQLFGNLRLREDLAKLQSEYDMLSGEFEAIRSKCDSERQEKETMSEQYEEEIEELNNRLMALSKYSDALNESKANMSTEITILEDMMRKAETERQQAEATLQDVASKQKLASTRRLDMFVTTQHKRLLGEAFSMLRENH